MDAGLLDTLVKLASLGTSGICIFSIFWAGWLVHQLPEKANANRHKTLRFFMGINVVIAIIAAATGIANAKYNAEAIKKIDDEKQVALSEAKNLETQFEEYKSETAETIKKYDADRIKNKEVAKSLFQVLNEKELASIESNADAGLKAHIRILKSSIGRLEGGNE